jgi:hypothetical protein
MTEARASTGSNAGQEFGRDGFAVLDLVDPSAVRDAASRILGKLQELSGRRIPDLASYHTLGLNEPEHEQILVSLTAWFRENRISQSVIERNLATFMPIVGSDLKIERNPFIRLNRPGRSGDSLGLHRDTFYGASAYELSVIIPFSDVPTEAAISVLPGSHKLPDSAFPTVSVPARGKHVVKGSKIHKVGFPYAPKVVPDEHLAGLRAVPLKIGQVLVFTLACIHGSKNNGSLVTRVSSDCRVANALAPVDRTILIEGRETPYYEDPIRLSPLTECGRLFASLG